MTLDSSWHNRATRNRSGIRWVVAHHQEAQALIQWFQMKVLIQSDPYTVYTDDSGTQYLILSGQGRLAAAAATAFLYAYTASDRSTAWINFGTAGHSHLPLGQLVLANRIVEQQTAKIWYPSLVFSTAIQSSGLICSSRIETTYTEEALYDMESAGFYNSATRFTSHELVHCLKIVSDNRESTASIVRAHDVLKELESMRPAIGAFVDQLLELSRQESVRLMPPREFQAFIQQWKFSVTQRHQLASLLRQWESMAIEQTAFSALSRSDLSGKAVLATLSQLLHQHAYHLPRP